jgi:hypothetical protein
MKKPRPKHAFSHTQRRSHVIIRAIYDHLLEHGPTSAHDLVEHIGCASITVGTSKSLDFNVFALDNKLPHRFKVVGGNGGNKVVWSLEERKKAA